MSNKFIVSVDPKADRKLAAHLEFLARVSTPAALRLFDEYEAALAFLGENASMCPIYTPTKPIDTLLRYWIFGKRCRIVFEIDGSEVPMYDIQDCRHDDDKNLI